MKKLLLIIAAIALLGFAAQPAQAGVHVGVGIGVGGPAYYGYGPYPYGYPYYGYPYYGLIRLTASTSARAIILGTAATGTAAIIMAITVTIVVKWCGGAAVVMDGGSVRRAMSAI